MKGVWSCALIIVLLIYFFPIHAFAMERNADDNTICGLNDWNEADNLEEDEVLSVVIEDNLTIITYVISSLDSSPFTTTKTISLGHRVLIDNVYSFTMKHDITFAYPIPVYGVDKAQIMTSKAVVSDTNSSSAYYPDTSSITTTITALGNPATFRSDVDIYKKTNNSYFKTAGFVTYMYGNGSYY